MGYKLRILFMSVVAGIVIVGCAPVVTTQTVVETVVVKETVEVETIVEKEVVVTAEPGEEDALADAALKEQDALLEAYARQPAEFGLPEIRPPARAFNMVDTSQFKKDPPYTVAWASQGPTNSWAVIYDTQVQYLLDTKYADIVEDFLYADANGNADKQVNDVEDLVAQQPDVLIVTPMGQAIKGGIERAMEQGIPVVLCTGEVDTADGYVTYVDRDNYLNGAMFAEWVAKQIDYEGKIIMESGIAGVPTAENRLRGARDVFAKYPDIEILGHAYADWSPVKGKQVTEAFLAANPEIDAVWSDSALMMVGAIEAFNEAGRDIPPMSTEPLNGFLRLAKENDVEFLAVGYPPNHSAACLDIAISILEGESVPNFVNIDVAVFDNTEIDDWYREGYSDDLWVDLPQYTLPDAILEELELK
jgi:ribose transport system substrate-binding protein